jgi:arylsulfatase A-like enzyme
MDSLNRRDFIKYALAGTTSLPFLAPICCAMHRNLKPNIVLIMADDLGYGDLGCYGNTVNRTPHIDTLASEGLKFTDFHANGPVCSPTRAALLTGRYQQRMGIETALGEGHQVPWLDNVLTIADYLKKAGYTTGAFGKWHLGMEEHPLDHGFDTYAGNMHGGVDYISHVDRYGNIDWWQDKKIKNKKGFNTTLVTDCSIRFIKEHRAEPFFLYVPYSAIHFPWMTPEDKAYRQVGGRYTDLSKLGPHRDENLTSVVKRMIEELDKGVGRIMTALKKNSLEDRTLVWFISDNGGYLAYGGRHKNEISDNGPFRGQKGTLYEGGHRVPGIAWWPGRIKPGMVSRETVMTMDLMPTFLELVDLSLPPPDSPHALDGISLKPLLFRGKPLPKRTLFWRSTNQKAARIGQWKLVKRSSNNPELYKLDDDTREQNDLAARHPELVQQLLTALDDWEKDVDKSYAANKASKV